MSRADWAGPCHALPAGLELCTWDRNRLADQGGYQFSLTVRTDSGGKHLVAAGVVTVEQLDSLPPCGQKSFDKEFAPATQEEWLGLRTRVTIKRRKTVMRATIDVYGRSNPEFARYAAWAGFPVLRGRPQLRLVVDNT